MNLTDSEENPKVIYTDISLKFGEACEDLQWIHCGSTPHRPETSGIAGRAVWRVKEGTSFVSLQSGLDERRWAESVGCSCYLRNVQDLLSDVKTPHEPRFEEPSSGSIIPFGAIVKDHPISSKDQARLHQFGKKTPVKHLHRLCSTCGEKLEKRLTGSRR